MLTLSELQSELENGIQNSKLAGAKRIQMRCDLSEFPRELFEIADTLEILDLTGNELNSLPDDFGRFDKLRILFLSQNRFEVFPEVLGQCPQLSMVGFKSNRIREISEHALPRDIRWLILTDNAIETLPDSIGDHAQLQKLMLAGNRLTTLPKSMQKLEKLELLRISANQLQEIPAWLTELPRLSWLAFSANPCTENADIDHSIAEIHWDEVDKEHTLGEGASGIISKARWQDQHHVAIKEFKGDITSDGLPKDEMAAAIAAGEHDHLIEVIGQIIGHPEEKSALALALIADDYRNLALPPCLDSCTRDNYHDETTFSLDDLLKITGAIASVAAHLHESGIVHGDLYGHNILINDEAHCLLGDFGAATRYHGIDPKLHHAIERIEVRAFGCLLEELLHRIQPDDAIRHADIIDHLHQLRDACLAKPKQRPAFSEIHQQIIVWRS